MGRALTMAVFVVLAGTPAAAQVRAQLAGTAPHVCEGGGTREPVLVSSLAKFAGAFEYCAETATEIAAMPRLYVDARTFDATTVCDAGAVNVSCRAVPPAAFNDYVSLTPGPHDVALALVNADAESAKSTTMQIVSVTSCSYTNLSGVVSTLKIGEIVHGWNDVDLNAAADLIRIDDRIEQLEAMGLRVRIFSDTSKRPDKVKLLARCIGPPQ